MSIKISELPVGSALSGTEEIPIVQSATTKKITAQDVADLTVWGGIGGDITDQTDLITAFNLKVDKVPGKGLSANDFTDILKTKLDGIEDGAEVNVNADWNAVSGDAQILNKPTIPSITGLVPYTGATANVDLGTFHLDAAKGTFTHNGSTDTLTANHTSGAGIGLLITKGGNNEGLKVNKTSGSGNAATIIGTLEATTIVKTGGTSTQFLMADGSTSLGGASITVGTTPVTSGTDGRVFFQAGGVVQQDSAFTFTQAQTALRIARSGTPSSPLLSLGNSTASAKAGLKIWNGSTTEANGAELFVNTDNNIYLKSNNANSIILASSTTNVLTISSNQASISKLNINGASTTPAFSVASLGTTATDYPFYISGLASSKLNLMNGLGQFGINKPSNTLGANLDVSASGALSTDIAFRVRNSVDTANIVQINGDGSQAWLDPANSAFTTIRSGSSTLIQWGNTNFLNIGIGYGHTMTPTTLYNTLLGSNTTIGSTTSEAVRIGAFGSAVGVSTINIGYGSNTNGAYSIKIGRHTGASSFGGTNSIHLGRTTSGNNIAPDDVFMTYFNSQSSSTLTRSNGSFGLLGQQAYIIANGTGANGLTTFMGDGGNTFVIRNHTSVPSLNITDSFQQYSADITAGNAAPHFRTENGAIVKVYQETTGVAASTLVSGIGTPLTDTDTFDGYTLKQIVKALRNQGLLA
jgi:hypothetical protein